MILRILVAVFIILLILIIIPLVESKKTRYENRCLIGLKNYKKYLKYKNFKNEYRDKSKNDALINLEILTDYMIIYNKECKDYNKSEEEIIKENLRKAEKEFGVFGVKKFGE